MTAFVTMLAQVRALVLVAAVLLAGLGTLAQGPRTAEAAGPCALYTYIDWAHANGQAHCSQRNFQKITTIMKINGVEVRRATQHGWVSAIGANAGWMDSCRPGAYYQTVVVHQFGDGNSSPARTNYVTSGTPRRLC